jgi:MoaA/NifB/PqqE/SkfB family radical SAM enzyme
MEQNELTGYMNTAVKNLAAKINSSNIREKLFLISFRRHVQHAAALRTASERRGEHIPSFLIASITNSCNLFCKGCYARANGVCGTTEKKLLTDGQWKSLFSQAEEMGISFCLLAGGEPLMRRSVLETAASFRRILFPVFTNGTMIDENYGVFFSKKRNMVPVLSIEGNKTLTDLRRGSGTYDRLCDAAEILHRHGVLWGASVTVTTENRDAVTSADFIAQLWENGARVIFFIEYVPAAPGTAHLAPGEADRQILAERTENLRKEFSDTVFLSFPGDEKYLGGCLAGGRAFFHINPYGDAEPCPFSPHSDSNVATIPLKAALNSPLFSALRDNHLTGTTHTGGCALFEQEDQVRAILSQGLQVHTV